MIGGKSESEAMDREKLIENYREDRHRREQFYDFMSQVFPSADFRVWYDRGFWYDRFIPHSLAEGDRIIANVSVTLMSLLVRGQTVRGLQIGAVGTLPEFRNRGFSRLLMEHVVGKYESAVDLIFLFANDEVVQFYPKFGFETYREVVFVSHRPVVPAAAPARRLDLERPADLALLKERLERRQPLSRLFGATDYAFITLWHALNIFPQRIFHVEHEDVIAFASCREGVLNVYDLIFEKPFDLEAVLSGLVADDGVKSVRWHFTPDIVPFRYDSLDAPEDSTLFVRGSFPVGGTPFKFPFTAQT